MESELRRRVVVQAASLAIADPPVPLPSESNDAWKIGELVLRICWRGDRTRLQREALVLEHLPAEVPHVRLADAGVVHGMSWTLTHWVPGIALSQVWAGLGQTERRTAAAQLGEALGAVHAWVPSPALADAIAARPAQVDIDELIGSDLNPLPVDRAVRLLEPAMDLDGVDAALVGRVGELLEQLRAVDPLARPASGGAVHGDVHLDNVVWDGAGVASLLDFEWVRLGPPDLELQPLLNHGAEVIVSIIDAYPAIVSHPDVVQRLWLYDLAAVLRDLMIKPVPADGVLPQRHPRRRLPDIVTGPAYIEALLENSARSR